MSGPKCDGEPRACCHGTRERQLDTLLSGISEEEERQRPHPSLVLFSTHRSHSAFLPGHPFTSCASAYPVPYREEGHQEIEVVRELHPAISAAKVSSV